MAKKINVKLIMELRDAGLSRNMIAATRHMSKNSVSDVIHIADQKGITFSDVRVLDEDAVYRMFYPDKFVVETLYSQPDYGYVHQELKRTGDPGEQGAKCVEEVKRLNGVVELGDAYKYQKREN